MVVRYARACPDCLKHSPEFRQFRVGEDTLSRRFWLLGDSGYSFRPLKPGV